MKHNLTRIMSIILAAAFICQDASLGWCLTPSSLRPRPHEEARRGKPVARAEGIDIQQAASRHPIIAAHKRALAQRFTCAEDDILVLSEPLDDESLEALHNGNTNFIYHIPKYNIVIRVLHMRVLGYEDYVNSLRDRLFPDEHNLNPAMVPIYWMGEITYKTAASDDEIIRPFVVMPFVPGEPLPKVLHERPALALTLLLRIMEQIFEFHRRLVFNIDYHDLRHYKVDTSAPGCPVKFFDYIDGARCLNAADGYHRIMIDKWVDDDIKSLHRLVDGVVRYPGDSWAYGVKAAIKNRLAELREPLRQGNGEWVEHLYRTEIFPFLQYLINEYERQASPAARTITDPRRSDGRDILRPRPHEEARRGKPAARDERDANDALRESLERFIRIWMTQNGLFGSISVSVKDGTIEVRDGSNIAARIDYSTETRPDEEKTISVNRCLAGLARYWYGGLLAQLQLYLFSATKSRIAVYPEPTEDADAYVTRFRDSGIFITVETEHDARICVIDVVNVNSAQLWKGLIGGAPAPVVPGELGDLIAGQI